MFDSGAVPRSDAAANPSPRQPFFAEIREGMVALRHHWPVFRARRSQPPFANFALSMGQGVFFVFAYRSARMSPALVGIALTLGSVGNVAGAAVAPRVSRRLGTGPALIVSTTFEGSAVLLTPLALLGAPAVWIAASFGLRNFFNPLCVTLRRAASSMPAHAPGGARRRRRARSGMRSRRVAPVLVGGAVAAAVSPTRRSWPPV